MFFGDIVGSSNTIKPSAALVVQGNTNVNIATETLWDESAQSAAKVHQQDKPILLLFSSFMDIIILLL